MSGKYVVQRILLILFIMMIAACSSKVENADKNQSDGTGTKVENNATGNNKTDDTKSAEVKPPSIDKPVELAIYYMWGGYPRETFMMEYGNHMVKKYPNISINYIQNEGDNSLPNLIAANTNIDLILTTGGAYASLQKLGLGGNINDLEKKFNYDTGKLHQAVYDVMKAINDGNAPGLPFKVNTLGFFYNKDLFDKFGVDYLKDGMTWDEVYNVAKVLTREEGGTIFRGLGFRNANFILQNQMSLSLADVKTNKAVFDTGQWKDYLSNFIRFIQLPGYNAARDSIIGNDPYEQFIKEETLAMLIQMNSDWPREEFGVKMNWDAATYPSFPSQPGVGTQPDVVFFAIPDTSKNRDAAFLAMASLTDNEQQTNAAKLGSAPVLKDQAILDVYGSESPDLKIRNAKALIPKMYASFALNQYSSMVTGNAFGVFRDVATGEKDLNTAMRDEVEEANKAIEEYLAGMTGAK